MNELLDVEIILKRNKYSKIYNSGIIILITLIIILFVTCIYKYKSYLLYEGQTTNNEFKLIVSSKDIKYLLKNKFVTIEDKQYYYKINNIGEIYYEEDGNRYQQISLTIPDLYIINNYIYQIKFLKENKPIISYLKELF